MTDTDAAKAIGVVPQTVYNWKNKKDFREVYDAVVNNPLQFAATVTAFSTVKAIIKLTELLDHNNVANVRYAIDTLLRIGGLSKERIEVTRREEKAIDQQSADDLIRRYEELKRGRPSVGDDSV